jgi:CspA family cold shock protein
MATGKVKWFNATKGYGFVQPDDGSNDVFVHLSKLEEKGLYDLKEDQKISYDTEDNRGKTSATNIELID